MDPARLRQLLRRWLPLVAVTTLLGAATAYTVSSVIRPVYRADGRILVLGAARTSALGSSGGSGFEPTTAQVVATDASLMVQPPLLETVVRDLGLKQSAESLRSQINVGPDRDTQLLDIQVDDQDRRTAARIANTLMADFVNQVVQQNREQVSQAGTAIQTSIAQLQQTLSQQQSALAAAEAQKQDGVAAALRTQIDANNSLLNQLMVSYSTFQANASQSLDTVRVASAASVPDHPAFPNPRLNALLGGLCGLVVGLGLAALFQYLDQGLRSDEDVQRRLGIPALGVIPLYRAPRRGRKLGAADRRRAGMTAEAYRRLRTALMFASVGERLGSLMLTSSRSREGKTRTAANLAWAFAAAGQRVLLVDCDLRRPRLHAIFGAPLAGGMSELLLHAAAGGDAALARTLAREVAPNLTLLTAGTLPPNPSELLASRQMVGMLRQLERGHDIVIIDTPPCDAVSDAVSVAPHASATLVVVESGRTSGRQAARTVEGLRAVGSRVVGVVLNKAKHREAGTHYYYYYYGGPKDGNGSVRSAVDGARAAADVQPVILDTPLGTQRLESVVGGDRAAGAPVDARRRDADASAGVGAR